MGNFAGCSCIYKPAQRANLKLYFTTLRTVLWSLICEMLSQILDSLWQKPSGLVQICVILPQTALVWDKILWGISQVLWRRSEQALIQYNLNEIMTILYHFNLKLTNELKILLSCPKLELNVQWSRAGAFQKASGFFLYLSQGAGGKYNHHQTLTASHTFKCT